MADTCWDPNGDEPVAASKLNNSATFNADDTADLASIDTTDTPDGMKYMDYADRNGYQFNSGSSETADEYYVVKPTTGGGRWIVGPDSGESEFNSLCYSIPEALPAVQATLDFGSTAQSAISTATVTVDGAAPGDLVTLGPPSTIEAGFVWSGFVSADDTVTIRLAKITTGTTDPASATWNVQVTKPNSLPSINQKSLLLYERLLGEYYTSTTLETELGSTKSKVAFTLLCARVAERRAMLAIAATRSAIENSATANAIMESYEGAGY